jgi:serine protease Do
MQKTVIRAVMIFLAAGILVSNPERSSAKALLPDFVELAKNLRPTVVNIGTEKKLKSMRPNMRPFGNTPYGVDPFQDFFGRFFDEQLPNSYRQKSLGSGFIISEDGYIITNNHVVDGADEIKVKLSDGREFKGEVKGADAKLDLALIKIAAEGALPAAKLGDSDAMEVGEWVIAIGNPFGLAETVTAGIISAKGRVIGSGPYDDYLQTDASINPGNSGGPLFNAQGEVVGINTIVMAGGQGIGFAIPVNMAKSIIPQLQEKGKVSRGWLGVTIQPITKDLAQSFAMSNEKGALVSEVLPDSPAEKAGLKAGDIIVQFDGKEIKEMGELPRLVAVTPIGKKAVIKIIREGKEQRLDAEIAMLKDGGVENSPATPDRLGVTVKELTRELAASMNLKESSGVVVTEVKPDGLAQAVGLQRGDVIKELNAKKILTVNDYEKALGEMKKGDMLRILTRHGDSSRYVAIKLD